MTIRRCLALVTIMALAAPALARAADGRLELLIRAQAVSGREDDARAAIARLLPKWAHPTVDEPGNLVLSFGHGQPHVLVAASIDEDGYLVSGITDDGYLRLARLTTGASFRLFDQFVYGQPVLIRTSGVAAALRAAPGRPAAAKPAYVPGVVATASTHLQRGRDQSKAVRSLDDVFVDVGARSRAEVERLGIRLLDTVALRNRVQPLAGGRTAGVDAQARGAALALVDMLGPADASRPPAITGTVTVAWTTQGLFGDRGLARLAREVQPDRVVLLSRGEPARDADPRGAFGRLGAGPVVTASDVVMIDAARRAGVTVQTVAALRGANAWPTTETLKVALPALFKDTPVETVEAGDIDALARLLATAAGLPAGAALAASAAAGPAGQPATASPKPPAGIFGILAPLVEADGVSGHETPVREAVARRLPTWARPEVDARGNLTVSFGTGGPERLFVAHTDEIGYEITAIRDDGTASVRKRGGFYDSLLEAHPVVVYSARGRVGAVIAPRADYQRAAEWQPKPDDVLIDFGTTSRGQTEALGVARGDTVTVRKQFVELAGTRGTARAIDDRAGCAALLAALARIDPAKAAGRVTFAWVVEEETGLAGSGVLAERLHPAYAFAVDTFVSSDSPVDPQRMALIPLGTGAVLRAADNSSMTPPATVAAIRALASTRGIPTTVGMTMGGNDGSQFARFGSIVVPISWPGRYSHSPVEVADRADLDALVDLIVALAGAPPGRM